MLNPGMYGRDRHEWETPLRLFLLLDQEFHFILDPCATPENAKCQTFYTKEQNGLALPWEGAVFCNPPYGRGIGDWIRKAVLESQRGAVVVCLTFVRSDTEWWHKWAMRADECRLIRGRLKFSGQGSAPFPSCILVFRPGVNGPPTLRSQFRGT